MTLNEYQIQENFSKDSNFFVASDVEGHKCVILKSTGESISHKLKTDFMILKTNVDMLDEGKNNMGKYHVIQCLSSDIDVNSQFMRVSTYMFTSISTTVDTVFIVGLFQDMQTLFETTADSDIHNLQVGVYGEMLLLKHLRQEGRWDLADKWHSDFYSKHDIEIDPKHKIEIKTTNKEKRIHSFRHNQLVQKNIVVYIVSVKVEECEQGTSLYDLLIEAQNQFDDIKRKMHIEKLIRRCKLSMEDKGIVCDEQHVYDEIKFYRAIDVPHIEATIPLGVTNVSYDVNFDANIPEIQVSEI